LIFPAPPWDCLQRPGTAHSRVDTSQLRVEEEEEEDDDEEEEGLFKADAGGGGGGGGRFIQKEEVYP
jgi:hypothetical protein